MYVIFGIVETLIAIRVILGALGASPGAGFAQLIYSLSAPLGAPFAGLFYESPDRGRSPRAPLHRGAHRVRAARVARWQTVLAALWGASLRRQGRDQFGGHACRS